VVRAETWPESLLRLVRSWVRDVTEAKQVGGLELPADAEHAVRTLLAGQRLRSYHATRLLDHEWYMITEQGLRVHSGDLLDDRIREAHRRGSSARPSTNRADDPLLGFLRCQERVARESLASQSSD
jgi:phosphatidylserine/phosphatidylglycerophosphate/cardiolipin synthase-like enzyme